MVDLGLSGIRVALPAARRAKETAALVERWGGIPIIGPVLAEVPVEDDSDLREATEEVATGGVAWSVHLTGVGTRRWFASAGIWGLSEALLGSLGRARLVARGPKSAAALKDHGLEPLWMPKGENSEEIAAWLAPQLEPGEAVALQIYGEEPPALGDAIGGAGARMIEVAPYRWALPEDREPGRRLVRVLVSGEAQALVITSAPQARHLFLLASDLGAEEELRRALEERVFVASVGAVACRGLAEEGVEADLVATPARLGALFRALAGAREAILAKAGPPPARAYGPE
ncbi:MAG: uroporphyrinogen-III synthase [Actinomycetota bacterium]